MRDRSECVFNVELGKTVLPFMASLVLNEFT